MHSPGVAQRLGSAEPLRSDRYARDGATPDQPIPSSKFALDDDEEELHPPGMHVAAGRSGGAATGEGLPKEGVYRGGAAGRNTVSLFPVLPKNGGQQLTSIMTIKQLHDISGGQ